MGNWIAEVLYKKHIHHITNIEIGEKLNVTSEYVSMVLNGKKTMPRAEERIMGAIGKIIKERNREEVQNEQNNSSEKC